RSGSPELGVETSSLVRFCVDHPVGPVEGTRPSADVEYEIAGAQAIEYLRDVDVKHRRPGAAESGPHHPHEPCTCATSRGARWSRASAASCRTRISASM